MALDELYAVADRFDPSSLVGKTIESVIVDEVASPETATTTYSLHFTDGTGVDLLPFDYEGYQAGLRWIPHGERERVFDA